jgi:hypothetical protein
MRIFYVLSTEHPNTITPTKMVLTITYSLHKISSTHIERFFFKVLCMEHPNTITPTKVVLAITCSLHKISSTHIEGFFFQCPKMYGYHHSNKNGFSKLLTPYIRLAPNALSGQSIYIYTSLWWWIINILTSVCYQNHNFSGKGLCNSLFPAINLQPQMLVEDQKIVICLRAALECAAYVIFCILSLPYPRERRVPDETRRSSRAPDKKTHWNESGGVKSSFYSGSSKDCKRWKTLLLRTHTENNLKCRIRKYRIMLLKV